MILNEGLGLFLRAQGIKWNYNFDCQESPPEPTLDREERKKDSDQESLQDFDSDVKDQRSGGAAKQNYDPQNRW